MYSVISDTCLFVSQGWVRAFALHPVCYFALRLCCLAYIDLGSGAEKQTGAFGACMPCLNDYTHPIMGTRHPRHREGICPCTAICL